MRSAGADTVLSTAVVRQRKRALVAPHEWKHRPSRIAAILAAFVAVLLICSVAAMAVEPTVEQLKARVASASVGDRAHLCLQIAEKQLVATDKLYAGGEIEKAKAALTDVVAFSELARDYSIQSHKYQKQTEIGVRSMARKLADIKHLVGHDDQEPIQDAMNRLQRVRDDLLAAMFPKGVK